jgi:hypothetical protein
MLFTPTRQYDDLLIRLLGNNRPELIDKVAIEIAEGSGADVARMRTRVDRVLLLAVDHQVARLEMRRHETPRFHLDRYIFEANGAAGKAQEKKWPRRSRSLTCRCSAASPSEHVGCQPLKSLKEGKAQPDANIPMAEKRELIAATLERMPAIEGQLNERIGVRAANLEKSHKRVRQAVALKVRQLTVAPQLPPDLLGVLVLQPVV